LGGGEEAVLAFFDFGFLGLVAEEPFLGEGRGIGTSGLEKWKLAITELTVSLAYI